MSQAPKTRSFNWANGTKSLINGTRLSVRLPRRTVPICVRLPIGSAKPFLIASTPAMNVVLTAPSPTNRTPSFPCAGAISVCLATAMGRVSFDVCSSNDTEQGAIRTAESCSLLATHCGGVVVVARNQAFAKFTRRSAGGDAKRFGEVARAQVAHLRAYFSHGELGAGE